MSKSKKSPALKFTPTQHVPSLFERAVAAHQAGRIDEAEGLYQKIPATDSSYALALHNLGLIRRFAGDIDGGIELIRQSLRLLPRNSSALNNLTTMLLDAGRPEEALRLSEQTLSRNGADSDAWAQRGTALGHLRRPQDALESFNQALLHSPDDPGAVWRKRGQLLNMYGHEEQAVLNFDQAIALSGPSAEILIERGAALETLNRFEEAAQSYEQSLTLDHEHGNAAVHAIYAMLHIAKWDRLGPLWSIAQAQIENSLSSAGAFRALSLPGISARSMLQGLSKHYANSGARCSGQGGRGGRGGRGGDHASASRLRIAYVSADFRNHPVSFLIAGVFEAHDRRRFEVIGISTKPVPDTRITNRIKAGVDEMMVIDQQSDRDVVEWMTRRQIDIAVDLVGHTSKGRPEIFANGTTPIHVNYLGFPSTSGVPYMDYIIGDRWTTPLANAAEFSEKLVLMPDTFQANDSQRAIAESTPSRAELGLPDGAFVFCCMNSTYKINPGCYDVWMRLLMKLPHSVLWLVGEQDIVQRHLRSEAVARGVAAERIIFAKRVPYEAYLAQYRQADLFLDTVPFNAGTTASDALWAGLPVLTQMGPGFAGRMAASLLHAVGLPKLVTRTTEEYETLALRLAQDAELLKTYRDRLKSGIPTAPLFDTRRFTRHLELAFEHMVSRYRRGLPPDHFEVPPIPG